MQNNIIVILEHLFNGQELEIEITKSIKHVIKYDPVKKLIKVIQIQFGNNEPTKVHLSSQLRLNQFIQICNNMNIQQLKGIK